MTRARVWLVQDNPLERELGRRALADDYDVEAFEDGVGILERIPMGVPPDVLVLDWHLPRLSGRELCVYLRRTHDAVSLPILALSAAGNQEDLRDAQAVGANDFVSKAATPAELCARVDTLIQIKSLQDALNRARGLAQRSREEADQANQAKDLFLEIASHELRTPLNSILGWASLLVDERMDEGTQRVGLETIRRNAVLQVRLIEDILDTTRIISGKLHLDSKAIDFSRVVRDAIEDVRPSADAKQQRLELRVADKRCRTWGDPERMQQAVGNLLANAVKFTPPEGTISVELRESIAKTDEPGGEYWELLVTDSGKGIEPELLPRLFERFRQQGGTASRRYSGLGLGLSLVRHIAEAHGGSVSAASEGARRGATFTLRVPRRVENLPTTRDSAVPGSDTSPAVLAQNIARLTLVVVEDNDDARELLVTVLTRLGAVVHDAASSETALALIAESAPDVLISDVGLPDFDGYELVRAVRARGYTPERLPAIALTAYARAEDRQLAHEAGFQAYLAKPVDLETLIATVARVASVQSEHGTSDGVEMVRESEAPGSS